VTGFGRGAEKLGRPDQVLGHAAAGAMEHAQPVHGPGMALLGGPPVPIGRLAVVLGDSLAALGHEPEQELGLGASLLGRLPQVRQRRAVVVL
jgi:hypothetical protein